MKTCPVCKAHLFDDMDTCYGCMYNFKDEAPINSEMFAGNASDDSKTLVNKLSARRQLSKDKSSAGGQLSTDRSSVDDNPSVDKPSIGSEVSVNRCAIDASTNNSSVFAGGEKASLTDVDESTAFQERGETQGSHSANNPLGIRITTMSGYVVSLETDCNSAAGINNGTKAGESPKAIIKIFIQPLHYQSQRQKKLLEPKGDKKQLSKDYRHNQQGSSAQRWNMYFEFADWDRSQDMPSTCILTLNSAATELSMINALSKNDCFGKKTFDPVVQLEI